MSPSGGTSASPAAGPPAGDGCPLAVRDQWRNLIIYAANWGLVYLASPVLYVGVTQATLLKRLAFSDTLCNLPASIYLWCSPVPVLVAWAFPQVRLLRPLIVTALLAMGAMGLVVAAALVWLGPLWVLAAVGLHAAVLGCVNGVMAMCQWEVLGKGVSESRRGYALGLAFGAGPVLAVVAALTQQRLLASDPAEAWIAYPWNFALLFAASAPVMLVGAALSTRFVVPQPAVEVERQPFVQGVLGGFGRFFTHRLILIAAVAYVLVYSGHEVLQNLSLYAEVALGASPEQYAGHQLALRFGFKIVAGFGLGWLLIATNPKMLLLSTAALTAAAVIWAMFVPGEAYLISFGILGAGELMGVYYPNYILGCSPKSQMRRNMAFASLITVAVGFAPQLYGAISDSFGPQQRMLGLQASFAASVAITASGILLVLLGLPPRPRPRDSDLEESDRAEAAPIQPAHDVPRMETQHAARVD
jgi:hypothetical protein